MESKSKKMLKCDKQIALRYLLTVFLPVWLMGCLILWLLYYAETRNDLKSLKANISHTLDVQKESINLDLMSISSDLKFLSRTVELSGFSRQFSPLIRDELEEELTVFLKAKGAYSQIAIIDLSGKEVMKIDYHDGKSRVTPQDRLLDQSGMPDFNKISQMSLNELYISPFDLKVEEGKVKEPYEPVLQFGGLLQNGEGEKRGVIMLTYYGKRMINRLDQIAKDQAGDFMFLNRNGYWMRGRAPDEEWGFMFEGRREQTVRQVFAEEWDAIGQQSIGSLMTANGLFAYTTVFPLIEIENSMNAVDGGFFFPDRSAVKSYYWKLLMHVPSFIMEESAGRVSNRYRFIALVMTVFLLASYILLVFVQYYRRCNASLELEKSKMDQILSYGEKVRTITNLNMLIDFIIRQASLILESERCSLMLLDEETGELCIRGAIGLRDDVIRKSKVSLGEGIAGLVAEEGKPLLVEVIDDDKRIGKRNAPYYSSKSFLSVPIKLDHQLIGVVNVTDKKDKKNPTYTELDLKILLAIVRQAAVAIENAQLSKELKYLTITDPLTHLYNYRHLMECLAYEIKRFKRFERPLSLLIIDIDDFKDYNDTFGQAEGNALLRQVGRLLVENLREVDIVCRYAGDEFVVVLPDTDISKVKAIAEKVRRVIEDANFKCPVTVSIGMARSFKGMNRHDLVLKADAALHKAKKEGKNRVYCQEEFELQAHHDTV